MKEEINSAVRRAERGGAGAKMLVVLLILFLIGHAGYNYIPVAYGGEDLKQEMQAAVLQGMVVVRGEKPVNNVKKKIQKAVAQSGVPNANIQVKLVNGIVQANVNYVKKINLLPFGIYQYDYVFNHTARP